MNSPSTQALLKQIDQALSARGFDQKTPASLYEPIAYTLDLGGKRLRPLLCLLSARLFSTELQSAMPIAVALEIFHNFTLLHDDLMDRSPIRRGQPTVHGRWGENAAILSGDVMSIEAYRALEAVEPKYLPQVFSIFNHMAVDICRGQQYDMLFEGRDDVTVPEYIEMIRLKTSVLLGASMRLGALVAGADEAVALMLEDVGIKLGLAFQIQDDYLDVYGDEATFGKPIGGDIANAKKTLMLLYTQGALPEEKRKQLAELLALPEERRAERIARVTELYTQTGADVYARGEIRKLTEEARRILSSLQLAEPVLEPLLSLFTSLEERTI